MMCLPFRCRGGLLFNRDGKCVTNEFRRVKEEEAAGRSEGYELDTDIVLLGCVNAE